MTDFLDEKRREITDRLKELKPLVDEYSRLEAAASALAGVGGDRGSTAAATATPRRRGPGRPRGSGNRHEPAAGRTPSKRHAKNQVVPPGQKSRSSARQKSRSSQRTRQKSGSSCWVREKSRPSRRRKRAVPKAVPDGAKAAARAPLRRCRSCRDSPASRSPSSPRRWASSRTTSTACFPAWSRKESSRRKAAAGTLSPSLVAPGGVLDHSCAEHTSLTASLPGTTIRRTSASTDSILIRKGAAGMPRPFFA